MRRYGYISDVKDHNDYPAAMKFKVGRFAYPLTASLAQFRPPVEDQGEEGACTAFGTSGAIRTLIRRHKPDFDFVWSHQQLYYDARSLEGTIESDAGAQIRNVIKTLSNKGVAHEDLWPFSKSMFFAPTQDVYEDAVQYKALSYHRVNVDVDDVKRAIASGYPVIVGLSVYASFEYVGSDGLVPKPVVGEKLLGGHCMRVDGYGEIPGYFTVVNSWGTSWGKEGICYIPESYLGDPKYGSDYWIVDVFGSDAEQQAGTA